MKLNNSTYTTSNVNTLEEWDFEELKKMLENIKPFKKPILFFNPFVPEEYVYYGKGVDRLLEGVLPKFNSKIHKGYMINLKLRPFIEETIKNRDFGNIILG